MSKTLDSNVSKLYTFNQQLDHASCIDDILNILITAVNQIIPKTDMSIIYLYDTQRNVLSLGAAEGVETQSFKKIAFEPGESLTGKVFLRKKPLLCLNHDDVSKRMSNISNENFRWFQEGTFRQTVKCSINMPLMQKDQCLGTITLNRHHTATPFSKDDINLLYTLTTQASRMISNIHMSEALDESRVKEAFSQLLIHHGSKEKIIQLLENKVHAKFDLDSTDTHLPYSIPITYNQNLLGHLKSSKPLTRFSLGHQRIIQYAVNALSTALSRDLDCYKKELQNRSLHFSHLLSGTHSNEVFDYLKLDKNRSYYCFAVTAGTTDDFSFARSIELSVQKYYPDSILFIHQSYFIILLPDREHLNALAGCLNDTHQLKSGAGHRRKPAEIHASYQEAVIAAQHPGTFFTEYASLGYHRLLYSVEDRVKQTFIEDKIGPLLSLRPELLTTLGTLIKNGRMQKKETAGQLYIHINTLYQRLKTIEDTLNISLNKNGISSLI